MGDRDGPEPLLEWGMAGWPQRVAAWMALTLFLAVGSYAVLRSITDSPVLDAWPVFVLQPVLTLLPLVVARQRSGLRVDDRGISVQGPASMRGSWRWEEVLEVAAGTSPDTAGPAVAVRPAGSTWDTPGPLSPVFAHLRRGQSLAHVQKVLAAECARRGVSFTTHPDGFGTARPGSSLRSDG